MTNDLIETPAEIENDAGDATESAVVEQEATDAASKTESAPAKTPEQIEVERLRRALTKRDRTQGQMHQEREQLRAEIERLRQQPAPTADPAEAPKASDRQAMEREAMSLAERIAEQRAFAAKCNTVAETGKKDFKDFTDSLNALIEEAGPLVLPTGNATPLGEQILDSEHPAKLIDYLGKHPEIAAELDGLTPGRIARKLAAIEQEMTAKPKTSSAPKPLDPIKGVAGGNDLASAVDDPEEWLKRRNAQLKKR